MPCLGLAKLGPSSHFLLALPPAQSFVIYIYLGKKHDLGIPEFFEVDFRPVLRFQRRIVAECASGQQILDPEDPGFIHWTSVTIRDLPRYKDDQLARDGPNCIAVHDAWRKKT